MSDKNEKPARVGRGSLTGRWEPRPRGRPNIRGGITIERDLPANTRLLLTGWTSRSPEASLCRSWWRSWRRREAEPVIRSPTPAVERMRDRIAEAQRQRCACLSSSGL